MSQIRATYLYYQALLLGTGMIGVYFWILITTTIPDVVIKFVFLLSGIAMVGSVYALSKAKTRPSRTSSTVASGLIGGAHAYMAVVLFPEWLFGTFMFFWLFIGLLISAAAIQWLPETDID